MDSIQLTLDFSFPDSETEIKDFLLQIQKEMPKAVSLGVLTDVIKGRYIAVVHERCGDKEMDFKSWLKANQITKSQAFALMETAAKAETLLGQNLIASSQKITRPALKRALEAPEEVQEILRSEIEADDTKVITAGHVTDLTNQFDASGDLLPDALKELIGNQVIPLSHAGKFTKELKKLKEIDHLDQAKRFAEEVAASEDPFDNIKRATTSVKAVATAYDLAAQVNCVNADNMDNVIEEAFSRNCETMVATLLKEAQKVEKYAVQLLTAFKKLAKTSDRLYVETGASTPALRGLIASVDDLCNGMVRTTFNDSPILVQFIDGKEYADSKEYADQVKKLKEERSELESKHEAALAKIKDEASAAYDKHWEKEVNTLKSKVEELKATATGAQQEAQSLKSENAVLKQRVETMPAINHTVDPKVVTTLQQEIVTLTKENEALKENLQTPEGRVKIWSSSVAEVLNDVLSGRRKGEPAYAVATLVGLMANVKFSRNAVTDVSTWVKEQLDLIHPEMAGELQFIGG